MSEAIMLAAVAVVSFIIGGAVCRVLLWVLFRKTEPVSAKSRTSVSAAPQEEPATEVEKLALPSETWLGSPRREAPPSRSKGYS